VLCRISVTSYPDGQLVTETETNDTNELSYSVYLTSNIKPDTNYTIGVVAISNSVEGPAAQTAARTGGENCIAYLYKTYFHLELQKCRCLVRRAYSRL